MAVFVVFLTPVFLILVERTGYHWWFGTAATQGLWLTPMYLSDSKIIHRRYRRSMTLFALASVPLSIGLLIGWLDFADLATLPMIAFYALGSLSVFGYAYVAARPVSMDAE